MASADDVLWDLVVGDYGFEPFTDQAPHTEAGIRVGSTEADVVDAYPDAVYSESPFDTYSITNGSGGYIVMVLSESIVAGIHVSDKPTAPSEVCG